MNNSGYIQTAKNPDLITYTVYVNGDAIPSSTQIHTISVFNEVNRIPTANLVISDGEAATQDFKLSNENLFVPGAEIQITAGYHSDEETLFQGIVIKHSIKVRSSKTLLCVECKDQVVKLTVGRKSKYFTELTDSEVFSEILDTYGLEASIEATNQTHQEIVQYNTSDWDFMLSRAQANGKLCFMDNGSINY